MLEPFIMGFINYTMPRKEGVIMTKFETVGVNRQFDARNIEEANKSFTNSCKCCCEKGIKLECDRCSISYTHDLICAYFNDKNNENKKGN